MLVYLAMGEAPFSQSIVKGISNILDKVIFFFVDLRLVFDFAIGLSSLLGSQIKDGHFLLPSRTLRLVADFDFIYGN